MTAENNAAQVEVTQAVDDVLRILAETFGRWLDRGPNEQPHFKNGLRPWGTGDLKWLKAGLEDARRRLATAGSHGGEPVAWAYETVNGLHRHLYFERQPAFTEPHWNESWTETPLYASTPSPGGAEGSQGREPQFATWTVRREDDEDGTEFPGSSYGVLLPSGDWWPCIAVDEADARNEAKAEWAKGHPPTEDLIKRITAILQADPVCGGRVTEDSVEMIAAIVGEAK